MDALSRLLISHNSYGFECPEDIKIDEALAVAHSDTKKPYLVIFGGWNLNKNMVLGYSLDRERSAYYSGWNKTTL